MAIETSQRYEYQQRVKAELDKLNAQLEEYKAKVSQAQADATITYHDQMQELYAKRDAAQLKLQEMQASGEAAWSEIQQGFETAWQDLTQAFDKASQQLK